MNDALQNEVLEGFDGTPLHFVSAPSAARKGAVLIVHGVSEHSGRYQHVMRYLQDHGWTVYSYDQRGHGLSKGERGFIRRFDDLLDDLDLAMVRINERERGKPLFLLGHSMGGAVVLQYLLSRRPSLSGVILSGPAIRVPDNVSPGLRRIAGVISALMPRRAMIERGDGSDISRDPAAVKAYREDPLVYQGKMLVRTAAEILQATQSIQSRLDEINYPILILHGGADTVTDPAGSHKLYEDAVTHDKTLKIYDGFFHEVFNEIGKEQVLRDLVDWLDHRQAPPTVFGRHAEGGEYEDDE